MPLLGLSMTNRRVIHENEIFRFFKCKLSIKETSQICDVSQKTVKQWDAGQPIADYYRRIMEAYAGRDLTIFGWSGWKFEAGELVTPLGYRLKPEQIEYYAIMGAPADTRTVQIEKLKSRRKTTR